MLNLVQIGSNWYYTDCSARKNLAGSKEMSVTLSPYIYIPNSYAYKGFMEQYIGKVPAENHVESNCNSQDNGASGSSDTPSQTSVVKVSRISISGLSHKIAEGKKIRLTASVFPENATDKNVTWVSTNTSVAIVTSSGLVTMKAKGKGHSFQRCQ